MQPTDRKLIEGAAKAMGYEFTERNKRPGIAKVDGPIKQIRFWNPLESKADAFDLMCALSLEPSHITISLVAVYGPGVKEVIQEPITPTQSKEAATMRAITRAAYAVWKEKENG